MEDVLANKQIEILLEMHSKKLINEIQSLKRELDGVKEQLSQQITKVRTAPPAQQGISDQFAAQDPLMPQAQPASPPQQFRPQASAEPIDNSGVSPADVSIEKIFYMGSR